MTFLQLAPTIGDKLTNRSTACSCKRYREPAKVKSINFYLFFNVKLSIFRCDFTTIIFERLEMIERVVCFLFPRFARQRRACRLIILFVLLLQSVEPWHITGAVKRHASQHPTRTFRTPCTWIFVFNYKNSCLWTKYVLLFTPSLKPIARIASEKRNRKSSLSSCGFPLLSVAISSSTWDFRSIKDA